MTITMRPTVTVRTATSASEHLAALRSRLTGQLITDESADFDASRKILSILVDRRPLAIVEAANAQDVAEAVNFARDHALPLAVRSGGHSIAHFSTIDDGIVISLKRMKSVTIDPEARIARVGAGTTSGDLAGPANAHGLALSTGDTHSVGMGGLVTGGGVGLMVRKYGLAIDNLLAAQVVTASGEIVTASADEHPDLFWAIRGGGGNFGIITEFTFRLAPVSQILGGVLILPASREVIRGYLDYSITAPDDLTTTAALMHAPPAPFIPAEWVGKPVLSLLVIWSGDLAEGEQTVAPLRALATPVADLLQPMPYPMIYEFTAHQAEPHAASIRMMFADELSDATLDAALDALNQASSPYSCIEFRGLGGAMARVSPDATAFAHRARRYWVAIIGLWVDASEDAAIHRAWTTGLWEKIRHEGSGVYVNFLEKEGTERIRTAYPPATYARLTAIKQQYDPENLFQLNQNIPPRP